MKKIDTKIIEEIKEDHFKYCKELLPLNGKAVEDEVCRLLCCENPFDFSNTDPKNPKHRYLKKEYWKYTNNKIDYKKFYKAFRTPDEATIENDGWSGIKLLKKLKVEVCPYCGINYISPMHKTKDGKIRAVATFDHYLPKSEYKFLALNLYNLIPSCKNCNSTFKHTDQKVILNPFFEAVEDNITFYIKSKSVVKELLKPEDKPEIGILYDLDNETVKNHVDVFALNERYNYFKTMAKSLIIKRHRYNNSYLTKLENNFKFFSKAQFEQDLIRQDIVSQDEVFLKFKSDIWKQLSRGD